MVHVISHMWHGGAGRERVPETRGVAISGGGQNIAAVAGAMYEYIDMVERLNGVALGYTGMSLCSASGLMAPFIVNKDIGHEREGILEFVDALRLSAQKGLQLSCTGCLFALGTLCNTRCDRVASLYSGAEVHALADRYRPLPLYHAEAKGGGYWRPRRVLAVSVTDVSNNAQIVPNVLVRSTPDGRYRLVDNAGFADAIKASAALAPLLPHIDLMGRPYRDGGLANILPPPIPRIFAPAGGGDPDPWTPMCPAWDVFIASQLELNADPEVYNASINTPGGVVTNVARSAAATILRDDIHRWAHWERDYGLTVRVWCVPVSPALANKNPMLVQPMDIDAMFNDGRAYMRSMQTTGADGRPAVRHASLSELTSLDPPLSVMHMSSHLAIPSIFT